MNEDHFLEARHHQVFQVEEIKLELDPLPPPPTHTQVHACTPTDTHTEFGAGVTLPSTALQHYGQIPLQLVQEHARCVFVDRVFFA